MKKESRLFLCQIDHLSGEEIADVIQWVQTWGARSVHAISTITKKGRPGCILLADLGKKSETALGRAMAEEFGIFGYHEIKTVHWHQAVSVLEQKVRIRRQRREIEVAVKFKIAGGDDAPLVTRVEHDDVVAVRDRIESTFQLRVSQRDLRERLNALAGQKNPVLSL